MFHRFHRFYRFVLRPTPAGPLAQPSRLGQASSSETAAVPPSAWAVAWTLTMDMQPSPGRTFEGVTSRAQNG
jgi:hypothetical protein